MRWRTPITLGVLFVILLGAAFYGWKTIVDPVTSAGGSSGSTTPPPKKPQPCLKKKTFATGTEIRAASFKVNVFNAGGVSGLAGSVLTSLTSKGFREGVADNPPPSVTATNVSILTSLPASPQAKLVQQQFKGNVSSSSPVPTSRSESTS